MSGKVVLVTGAASGLGLELAIAFASRGDKVAICGRDEQRMAAASARITVATSADHLRIVTDLIDTPSLPQVVDQVISRWGRIDVLINNAAIAPRLPIDRSDAATVRSIFDVNVLAPHEFCRLAWPHFERQQNGLVINISSLAAVDPLGGFSAYGGSKAWIEALTHAINTEGNASGISAFAIRLGAMDTKMLRQAVPEFPTELSLTPQEVARRIVELAIDPDKRTSACIDIVPG